MALGRLARGGLNDFFSMSYILINGRDAHVPSHTLTHIRARIHTQSYILVHTHTDPYTHAQPTCSHTHAHTHAFPYIHRHT